MQQFSFQPKMIKLIGILCICLFCHHPSRSQQVEPMRIQDVIERAKASSLMALKTTNLYLASYWRYNTYKASFLPQVNLDFTPVDYDRSFSKQWDSNEEVYAYFKTQVINSYAAVSVDQNLAFSGGTLSLASSLSHLENLNQSEFSAYNASPIQLVYYQPLFGFNEFKWQKQLAPLSYELAKREYLEAMQTTTLNAINYYFDLLIAQVNLEVAESDKATSDTLYQIGVKRFEIAAINKEDLLNLELNKYSASIQVGRARKELNIVQYNLNSFLGINQATFIKPIVPEDTFVQNIPLEQAMAHGLKYNPEPLRLQESLLDAEQKLDREKKESRFSADLVARFGLNNSDNTLPDAYSNLINNQAIAVGIKVPLVDWGQGKGKRMLALKEKEVVQIEIQQNQQAFEQEIVLNVFDYNLQHQLVANALRASEIAEEAYQLTKNRFIKGNADVLKLNAAAKTRQQEKESYIDALYNLWKLYYQIQQLTLYDYNHNQPLAVDFDNLIK